MDRIELEARIKELELELLHIKSGKTEEILQKEISFRQAIEQNVSCGIAVFDETGKQVYVNQSFCKLVGWDEHELLNDCLPFKYWPSHDIEINTSLFHRILALDNAPQEIFEIIFSHKSGNSIPVQVILTQFIHDNSKIFWIANVSDVTERKQTEQALKESQERLPLLIKNSNDIFLLIDENGEQFFISDVVQRITGYTAEELAGPITNVINPDDLENVLQAWNNALANKETIVRVQYRHIHKEKKYIWVEAVAQNFLEHPSIKAVVVNVRDITANKEIELKLKESETKFKEIIQQINDGIVVFDEQGKIVVWNQGAENIFGIATEEAMNITIADVQYQFTPAESRDKKQIENKLKRLLTLQTPQIFNQIKDNEITTSNSDSPKNIQSIVFPIQFNEYNLFCSVLRDTTETKQYEKELLQLNSDKDRFISILAHDLRSPFHSILGFLELLTRNIEEYDLDEIKKYINIINNSAERVFNLLEATLIWARAQSGKLPYVPGKQNLSSICNVIVGNMKLNATNKKIIINQFVSADLSVFADADMLRTILHNLISNAVKFTKTGGKIDIYAEQQDHPNVTITISDNGVGIEQKRIADLFDISKVNTTEGTANEVGTGLGLLLCKEFIEIHNGKIWVESEPGKGSKFKFTLPCFN
ncbi:MAG TPA: PAS domain-containing sensor histidine kinase [Prolixibacteraceae bacterium]|nr:PAS domain-containing sensor histidine kinase [Prolixibacteraceae bacterium]